MNAIVLPEDLQAWAEAEVSAGYAPSVDAVAAVALAEYRTQLESLRQSLDEAEADREGWRDLEEVFDELDAKLELREAFEEAWLIEKAKRA